MFELRGMDGLRWELGLLLDKMIRGYLQDCSTGHYPLKTLNGQLNNLLGCPRGWAC